MSLTTKILEAAMRSSQHVFVNYYPHVNGINVFVHPKDTDYQSKGRVYLFDATVYLDHDGANEKLAAVLKQLEELG